MGLDYKDSIILFNRYESKTQGELYFGTRFDNVRVELTQGANIQTSGLVDADSCVVKIPIDSNLPKPYKAPQVWKESVTEDMEQSFTINKDEDFFILVKKENLGIALEDVPVGIVTRSDYPFGLFEELSQKYGYVYKVHTVDVYNLIPRFQVGGK